MIIANLGCQNKSNQIIDPPILDVKEDKIFSKEESQEIIKNAPNNINNKIAFKLFGQLKNNDNPTFSPLSISVALAMAYGGANGQTEQDMKNVLEFADNTVDFHKSFGEWIRLINQKNTDETNISIINNQWLQKDFNIMPSYIETLKNNYKTQLGMLDFKNNAEESTETINNYIKEKTHNEIHELFKKPLDKDTRLVLTNAICFKAKWLKEFDPDDSDDENFILKNNTSIEIKFMKQINNFAYDEDDSGQYLLKSYKDKDFAALFVLPKEGQFNTLESRLDAEKINAIISNLKEKKVSLWLPKFSQNSSPNLKKVLGDLGLNIIFDNKADFSKITGTKDLFVGDVVQEAVVKMHEEGTTAAAATAVIMVMESFMLQPVKKRIEFHATRPFYFFILHKPTNGIMFMGRIDKPKQ